MSLGLPVNGRHIAQIQVQLLDFVHHIGAVLFADIPAQPVVDISLQNHIGFLLACLQDGIEIKMVVLSGD